MALTTCPECGGQVSTSATSCPHCGFQAGAQGQAPSPSSQLRQQVAHPYQQPPVQPAAQEVTYYSDETGVRITSARAILGNNTYSMANISSVGLGAIPANRTPATVATLCGLVMMFVAIWLAWDSVRDSLAVAALLGALFGLPGLLMLLWGVRATGTAKPTYVVCLRAAGGETNALLSQNKGYIDSIIQAINEAIVKRG